MRHGRLKILPHLQSLPRFRFLPLLDDLTQILPAGRRPHPAHQRLALLSLLVRKGAFNQPARGESLHCVVRLDAVAVRASRLQLQLLEERQVLVDWLSRFSSGGKVVVLGKQQLALVLVDRLSNLLARTLGALCQLSSVKLCEVTSSSKLLLLLALEQLLLVEVTLLQLRRKTFTDDVLQKVRFSKICLSRLETWS